MPLAPGEAKRRLPQRVSLSEGLGRSRQPRLVAWPS